MTKQELEASPLGIKGWAVVPPTATGAIKGIPKPKAKTRAVPKEADVATELKNFIAKFQEIKLEEAQLRRELEKDSNAWESTKANFDRLIEAAASHDEQVNHSGEGTLAFKDAFEVAIINPKKLTEMKKIANFSSNAGRLRDIYSKSVPELTIELNRIKRIKAATEDIERPAPAKRAKKNKP